MQNFLKEFKAFALRGNVIDMAVGVIIGGSFGKLVSSFVGDIVMPPLGKIIGDVDFNNLFLNLSSTPVNTLAEATAKKVPVIAYGHFLTGVVDFIIIAFVIFCLISLMNKFKRQEVAEPDRLCPFCKGVLHKDATRCPHCTSQLPQE